MFTNEDNDSVYHADNGHGNHESEQIYAVQHLKTYSVDSSHSPLRSGEVVDLLLSNDNIDIQEYTMKIIQEHSAYYLVLAELGNNQDEAERFQTSCIRVPRYKMTTNSITGYNNLLMFTIEARSLLNDQPKEHEVHVFQVCNCPAKDLVYELLRLGAVDDLTSDFSDSQLIRPLSSVRRNSNWIKTYTILDGSARNSISRTMPTRPAAMHTLEEVEKSQIAEENVLKKRREEMERRARRRQTLLENQAGGEHEEYNEEEDEEEEEEELMEEEDANAIPQQKDEYGTYLNTQWINNEIELLNRCLNDVEEEVQEIREHIRRVKPMVLVPECSVTSSSRKPQPKTGNENDVLDELQNNARLATVLTEYYTKVKFTSILASRIDGYSKTYDFGELVRQMYGSLTLIVKFFTDPETKELLIVRDIKQPFLPKFTLSFIRKVLKKNEVKVFTQLGPNWNIPREGRDMTVFYPDFRTEYQLDSAIYGPSLFEYRDSVFDQRPMQRYMQEVLLDDFAKQVLKNDRELLIALVSQKTDHHHLYIDCNQFLQLEKVDDEMCHVRNQNGDADWVHANTVSHVGHIVLKTKSRRRR